MGMGVVIQVGLFLWFFVTLNFLLHIFVFNSAAGLRYKHRLMKVIKGK